MARKPRPVFAGAIYHITARGNRGQEIVRDDVDRAEFRKLLIEVVERLGWRVVAWTLLDNHFHLLVETPAPNVSAGMQRLNGEHARRFNRRHGLTGHLFQGRFFSKLVRDDAYLRAAAAYIARNPVRAMLASNPRSWPWGSHPAVAGGVGDRVVDLERIAELFGGFGGDPIDRYLAAVEAARPGRATTMSEGAVDAALGSAAVRAVARPTGDAALEGPATPAADDEETGAGGLRRVVGVAGRSASEIRRRLGASRDGP